MGKGHRNDLPHSNSCQSIRTEKRRMWNGWLEVHSFEKFPKCVTESSSDSTSEESPEC